MMSLLWLVVSAAVTLVISASTTKTIIPILTRRGLTDQPNFRSSHSLPTPRGGGIALVSGLLSGVAVWSLAHGSWALVPSVAIIVAFALVGLFDDLVGGLAPGLRLIAQVIIAITAVHQLGGNDALPIASLVNARIATWIAWLATIIWVVSVVNITNFLDGIDGYAASQAIWVGLAMAVLGLHHGSAVVTAVGVITASASAGFLRWNWHPAKIFLGDVGSYAIGACFAVMGLLDLGSPQKTMILVTLLAWAFAADGLYTLAVRILRGHKPWIPHRQHLYQRLVRSGLRHDQVVLRLLFTAGMPGVLGLIAALQDNSDLSWLGLAAGIVWLGLVSAGVKRRAKHAC